MLNLTIRDLEVKPKQEEWHITIDLLKNEVEKDLQKHLEIFIKQGNQVNGNSKIQTNY